MGCLAGGPIGHAIFRVSRLHRMLTGQALRRDVEHRTARECRAGKQAVLPDLLERLAGNLIEATGD